MITSHFLPKYWVWYTSTKLRRGWFPSNFSRIPTNASQLLNWFHLKLFGMVLDPKFEMDWPRHNFRNHLGFKNTFQALKIVVAYLGQCKPHLLNEDKEMIELVWTEFHSSCRNNCMDVLYHSWWLSWLLKEKNKQDRELYY